ARRVRDPTLRRRWSTPRRHPPDSTYAGGTRMRFVQSGGWRRGWVRSPDPALLRVVEAENQALVARQSAHAECDSAWSGERTPPPTTGPARLASQTPDSRE